MVQLLKVIVLRNHKVWNFGEEFVLCFSFGMNFGAGLFGLLSQKKKKRKKLWWGTLGPLCSTLPATQGGQIKQGDDQKNLQGEY